MLKQTKINDIKKLVDLISLFPKLKLLNLEDNEIEKEEIEKVKDIIEQKGFNRDIIKY